MARMLPMFKACTALNGTHAACPAGHQNCCEVQRWQLCAVGPLAYRTLAYDPACCDCLSACMYVLQAINNDVKRQLFHSDAVGPLMQLAEAVSEGSPTQDAIRAALAQLGLVYLLPAPPAAAVAGNSD